jgi:beta-mannosidase
MKISNTLLFFFISLVLCQSKTAAVSPDRVVVSSRNPVRVSRKNLIDLTPVSPAQNSKRNLNATWEFRESSTSKWYPAKVPGTIHSDLLANQLIKDPFIGTNEKDVQWVEEKNWDYVGSFIIDSLTLNHNFIDLNFEGLDTYATVYLNDSLVLKANNMFRSWNVNVKNYLKLGKNKLNIQFESALKVAQLEAAKLTYTLPEGLRVFSRKAQYQYGWDWAPKMITCGIWKPINIVAWDAVKIESLSYQIKELTNNEARVNLIYRITCQSAGEYELQALPVNEGQTIPTEKLTKRVFLKKGFQCDSLQVVIKNPKLWWCTGYGNAFMYRFNCAIATPKIIESRPINVGLRKIELVQQKDKLGTSFFIKLNDVPVFMKGANYVPQDVFLHRLNEVSYSAIIQQAKEANMNMLRVWGGGVYPNQQFYDLCDSAGILLWQDFMFACAMYPGNKEFTSNVKKEIQEQVEQLSHHPSLAIWCGNNEIDEGWKNWGWQKQFKYSKKDSTKIYNDYRSLFDTVIPTIIKKTAPTIRYWNTSPSIGWGHRESLLSGDSHYWGVWWGLEPFSIYQQKIGRFANEYGFQGMPDVSTIKKFNSDSIPRLNSETMLAHQKHKTGYETIHHYMKMYYKIPEDFKKYVYVSQLLQRDGMKVAMEAHRSSKPYCMGSLFWQLNDCWPVTSWSAIDYYHTPKAVYYSTKKSFNKFLITAVKNNTELSISVVSDSIHTFKAQLSLIVMTFEGKILWKQNTSLILTNEAATKLSIPQKQLPLLDTSTCFLNMQLILNAQTVAENNYYFAAPKHLKLPKGEINLVRTSETGYTLSSSVLLKDVYLFTTTGEVTFSDNYFDVTPGTTKKIRILKGQLNTPILNLTLNNL